MPVGLLFESILLDAELKLMLPELKQQLQIQKSEVRFQNSARPLDLGSKSEELFCHWSKCGTSCIIFWKVLSIFKVQNFFHLLNKLCILSSFVSICSLFLPRLFLDYYYFLPKLFDKSQAIKFLIRRLTFSLRELNFVSLILD